MRVIIMLILSFSFASVWGQNKKGTIKPRREETALQKPLSLKKVPQPVRKKFAAAYPNASVNGWYLENDHYYKVVFRDPPTLQQLIVYDTTGRVIRKETELDNRDIPDSISGYHHRYFPNEDYSVWRSMDKDDTIFYSAVAGYTLYFDGRGRFIRKSPRFKP